jgi:ribonuclease HI
MKNVTLYTDGGARGNPGVAGAGAVLFDESGKTITETAQYLGEKTNNYAEYAGVVLGLEMVARHFGKKQCSEIAVHVHLDSELVCKQLNHEYQVKEETLFPLFIKVHNMTIATFKEVTFEHVPREKNAHADRLANEAMDRTS